MYSCTASTLLDCGWLVSHKAHNSNIFVRIFKLTGECRFSIYFCKYDTSKNLTSLYPGALQLWCRRSQARVCRSLREVTTQLCCSWMGRCLHLVASRWVFAQNWLILNKSFSFPTHTDPPGVLNVPPLPIVCATERTAGPTHPRHALLERQAVSHAQHRRKVRTEGDVDRRERRPDVPAHRRGPHQLARAGHVGDLRQQAHHWPRALLRVGAAAVQMPADQQNGRKLQDLQRLRAGGLAGLWLVPGSCVWCHMEVSQRQGALQPKMWICCMYIMDGNH